MKVQDLIDKLNELKDLHGDLTVKIMTDHWRQEYEKVDYAYLMRNCKSPLEYYIVIE